ATGEHGAAAVSLTQNQSAQIAAGRLTLNPLDPGVGADQFVRAIAPPPVILPRTLRLTFDRPLAGGVRDARGAGTGLTHRLPGTGSSLPERDPNLRPAPPSGRLE